MYITNSTQIKFVDFIRYCGEKDKILMLILKNLEEFHPEYIEIENRLKNSSLAEKVDFKIYAYNFSEPKDVENVAKYIEYEHPDIILILSNTPIEGANRKLFNKLRSNYDDILIIKLGRDRNKLNGNGLDNVYDAVFSNVDEVIEFFEKACTLIKPKGKPNRVVQVSSIDEIFKNVQPFKTIEEEEKKSENNTMNQNNQNVSPQKEQNTSGNVSEQPSSPQSQRQSQQPLQDANMLLLLEVLKDLRDSIEELKEKIEKEPAKKVKSGSENTKKSGSTYNIVNIVIVALLLILIGIILFYK